jgi:hypothetical protein
VPADLTDAKLKIQRAYKHFGDFYDLLDAFIKSDPCHIIPERDPNTHEVIYRVGSDIVIDNDLRLIAGDMIQNLRSALDYSACALVLANGGNVGTHTSFPILPDALGTPKGESEFTRKVEGMSDKAKDLIRACKPYQGGNKTLWWLHELNRREKHRLLFAVGGFINNWSITQHIDATNAPLRDVERWGRAYASDEAWAQVRLASFPLKAGDVLFVDRPNAPINKDIKFGVQVAIHEPGICDAEPLVSVLWGSFVVVRGIVETFTGL